MRNYIFSANLSDLEREYYDVLIIGSGIAGLYASLHIDLDKKCAIITKSEFDGSNSWFAQGGIAAVIADDDKMAFHVEDTLKAGAGLCDRSAVELLVSEGPKDIQKLVSLNVPFDVNPEGELQITREGGHSHRRIVHCGGDSTGRETTRRLGEIVLERKNITFLLNTFLIDLVTQDGRIVGAIVLDKKPKFIVCPNIILCTGGIGQLYANTTNPKSAVGDGIAAAMRCGANVVNMEMVQFHPTTLIPHSTTEKLFLISEAVRGEGGILKNSKGEAFMQGVHPLADLAPRDIVTRAILAELARSGEKNVFLDVSSMSEEFFAARFPTIYATCKRFGINVTHDSIPVRPAQHYLMGGIKTDSNGMTNIDGLYAAGECASTGVHGANRLASNSMLECLVYGRRSALHINEMQRRAEQGCPSISNLQNGRLLNLDYIFKTREHIKQTMSQKVGAIRHTAELLQAQKDFEHILDELQDAKICYADECELYNMAQNADKIVSDALARKESIGAHYLVD